MKSMTNGWLRHSLAVAAALLVAGFAAPVWAGYELPPGERITNLPHIPRAMPQKEAYESYDPVIGRNFDIKNFWLRADLRVRPEFRNGVCFGAGSPTAGACNTQAGARANTPSSSNTTGKGGSNDFYVQQWVRLGIGYDLSPDVNFYMEIIDAATWGANGNVLQGGSNNSDALHHSCGNASSTGGTTDCRLGVRAAYVLVRNLGNVQGLSMKAGRQYVIFGNHSLFGHFDWANTGYSHDGIMFQYSTKAFDSHFGWIRNTETDIAQAAHVGSLAGNVGGGTVVGARDGGADADTFIFYNQIKSIPGMVIEPYYFLYLNQNHEADNRGQGMGTVKMANQIRHNVGNRIEVRKGGFDFINELTYQFGRMSDNTGADNQRNVAISAWATRNWLGYTFYDTKMKTRIAGNLDWASGDGDANCNSAATCRTAGGTFENFWPTNHIHMGYMDIQAWRNMFQPALNLQLRPTGRDHLEVWFNAFYLANARDNWYRGAQGVYTFSKANNTKKHVGDEIDISWTRMFADGKVAFQATYGHFFAGGYLTNNMPNNPANQAWGFVQLWMNF